MSCLSSRTKISQTQRVPKVEESMDKLKPVLNLLGRGGLHLFRVSRNGSVRDKTFNTDKAFTTLSYVPTSKGPSESTIFLKDIWEVRVGNGETSALRKAELSEDQYGCSIVCDNGVSWDFVFESEDQLNSWVQTLAFLIRANKQVMDENPQKTRIVELWMQANSDKDKKLSFSEVSSLLDRLNLEMDRLTLRRKFSECDVDGNGSLDFEEFQDFFKKLSEKPNLLPIFESHCENPNLGMTVNDFAGFLSETQKEILTRTTLVGLHKVVSCAPQTGLITFSDFCNFLLNPARNSCVSPFHERNVYMDMTRPLHEYFINSSHNTYLSGDQLTSTSKPDMYRRALVAGCRCVELDCWDGDGEPIIYHGYTRTSKILFQDVITAINESAFTSSPYPVILSMEVHTSSEISCMMARIMRKTFGTKLYTFADAKKDKFSRWSPEKLKNKILVKWKLNPDDEDDDKERDDDEQQEKPKDKHHGTSCPELSATVIVGAHKTKNWGKSAERHFIQSFAEGKLEQFFDNNKDEFTALNTRMMSRIYPKGSRINSSNYDPMKSWSMGSQVVALNFQTWDAPLRLNAGFFQQNGNCGYLLKPDYLRDVSLPRPSKVYVLTVEVIMGTQLPRPENSHKGEIIDPFVLLQFQGDGEDEKRNEKKETKYVDNNGFAPEWNETFTFTFTNMDLAVLRLRVIDHDIDSNDEVAECHVPIQCLRMGVRAVPLRMSHDGRTIEFGSILCKFGLDVEPLH